MGTPTDSVPSGDADSTIAVDARTVMLDDQRSPSLDSPPSTSSEPAVGSNLGRYVVLEAIGAGAMGHVLRAYDPKLQREVALKVVRTAQSDARARMLREARSMAQLSHPNVVAVYDAEETAAGVVLVMEFVDGVTLRQWVDESERSWTQTVQRFLRAGRGLLAAHNAGLLHRDFKPSNVLVAASGEVKVTDFGLAKPNRGTGTQDSVDPVGPEVDDVFDDALTRPDTVMGTPRYMAPEQHAAGVLDAAADQYAFCVALWEALCGAPPFRARRVDGLAKLKREGPPPWPSNTPVPTPIAEAVRRGLAVEPTQRWPGMAALLDALSFDPARRRRRWSTAVGALAIVGLGALAVRGSTPPPDDRCRGAQDKLRGVWDADTRQDIQRAFIATDASYAASTWSRTAAALDDYAAEWVRTHTDSCEATMLRGDQSETIMDRRMACLRRTRVALAGVTSVFADADVDVVRKAAELVASLPSLDHCSDVDALTEEAAPPPANETEAVDQIRARLAEAKALIKAGRFDDAKTTVARAREQAAEVTYEPIEAEVQLTEANVALSLADASAAESGYRSALQTALAAHQFKEAEEAAAMLMFVVGYSQRKPEEGLRYREVAEGLVRTDVQRAQLLSIAASIALASGDPAAAEADFRRSLAVYERVVDADNPSLARTMHNLALSLGKQGKFDESIETQRRSVAALEASVGPDHPDVGTMRGNLGSALLQKGDLEAAEAELRAALRITVAAVDETHPDVARVRHNMSTLLRAQQKPEEAEAHGRAALAAFEANLGPDHPTVARARNHLGLLLREQGHYEEAEAEHRRALRIMVEHAEDQPYLAATRLELATLLVQRERYDRARPLARQAWDVLSEPTTRAALRAQAAFTLALAEAGDTKGADRPPEALELARIALQAYREADAEADAIAEVEAWIGDASD